MRKFLLHMNSTVPAFKYFNKHLNLVESIYLLLIAFAGAYIQF